MGLLSLYAEAEAADDEIGPGWGFASQSGRGARCEDMGVLARIGKEMWPRGGLRGWKDTARGLGGLCVVKGQL